jgi:hypothetical protein
MTTGQPDAGRGHGREDMDRDEDTDDTTFQTWLIKLTPMSQVTSGAITARLAGIGRDVSSSPMAYLVLSWSPSAKVGRHRYGGHIA